MPRSFRLLLAFILIAVVGERASFAASVEPRQRISALNELVYDAPSECPSRERLEERVHALLQGTADKSYTPLRIRLHIERLSGAGYSVSLQVEFRGGDGLRQFGGGNCDQLVEASAWMIAFILNPELDGPRESAGVASFPLPTVRPQLDPGAADARLPEDAAVEEPSPASEPRTTPLQKQPSPAAPPGARPVAQRAHDTTPRASDNTPRGNDTASRGNDTPSSPRRQATLRHIRRGAQLGARGVLDMGHFRAVTPGVAATTGLIVDAWNPQLEFSYFPTKTFQKDGRAGRFWMLTAAARLCRRAALQALLFAACAGVEGGAIHGVAKADHPRPRFGPWIAPALTLGLSLPVGTKTRNLFGVLRAHGAVPLIRNEFQQDSITIYRPPPAVGRLDLGLEYWFE